MATRSGVPQLPLPTLLTRARDISLEGLHRRLAEEGFEGVRFAHGSIFRHIDAEGTRLTALAERSGLTKQALGELVVELEERGYLERLPDMADRRAKIIRLTDHGRAAQSAAGRILGEAEQRWSRVIGGEDVAVLRRVLERMVALEGEGLTPR